MCLHLDGLSSVICLIFFEGLFELRWALFVVVEAGFLFNINAEWRGQDRIPVYQAYAIVLLPILKYKTPMGTQVRVSTDL